MKLAQIFRKKLYSRGLCLPWPWPLTFDLLSIFQAQVHTYHLILVKLTQIITKIWYSPCFPGHCLSWPRPLSLWPQNLIRLRTQIHLWPKFGEIIFILSTYGVHCSDLDLWPMNPNTSVTKIWRNSFIGFLDVVFTRFRVIACCDLDL